MIPAFILRYLPNILAIVVTLVGVWYYGHLRYRSGAESVHVAWTKEKAEQAKAYEARERAVAKLQNERDLLAYKVEHDLQPKLAATSRRADDLARRLREHYARPVTLPEAPGTSPEPDGTSGNRSGPDDLDRAIGNVLGACQRDAIRLNAWIEFYSGLRATQSGDLP